MKNVVVTGANGFIGSALVHELLNHGIRVNALVRGRFNNLPRHKNLKIYQVSLDKFDTFDCEIKDIDVFYHLAWEGSSGEGRSNPMLQITNIKWTMDSLYLAERMGAKRFVGAGSLMEKEVLHDVPVMENKPSDVSVYGTAKLSSHYMTKAVSAKIGIEHLWCYLTAYGIGDNPHRFVCATIKKMLEGKKVLQFTKADQYYDFVYITDTARALYLLGAKGKPFCAYNIGSGSPNKLNYYITEMKKVLNADCELDFGAYEYKGIYLPKEEFECADLQNDTGFRCNIAYEDGIIQTSQWLRSSIL